MIISKLDRKTKGNNYIRQKEKASEATTSQVVHFSGGSVKETASTLGNHLSYRLTGRKEMKKNAKSTLLMIIASVVNIVGRCKGRIIIAPEHCLSYQGKRKRCNYVTAAYDHCRSDIKHGLRCNHHSSSPFPQTKL